MSGYSNYRVRLAKKVRADIGSWGLPRKILIQVLCRLQDLRLNPKEHLKEQVVPYADMFTMPFALREANPGRTFSFLFFVRQNDEKAEFQIIAGRLVPDDE